jgi:hypothetical protein
MDTLWASLVALFLIAIGVVLAFNLLQGRQSRLRDAWRQTLATAARPSARAPAARAEPTADGADPSAVAPATRRDRIEPSFGPAGARDATPAEGREANAPGSEPRLDPAPRSLPAAAESAPPLQTPRPAARVGAGPAPSDAGPASAREAARSSVPADATTGPILDPRLDCIVAFGLGAPVAAERLLSVASTLRRAGSKPIAVEADDGAGRWSLPHASFGAARRVRAGVLLANRHGPLNAMEFSEFANAMQALGRAIGAGGAIVPEMAPVLEHARQLDEACAQLDAVIGLNVETPTALSPDDLAALAAGLGLQERGNNRFTAIGEEGEALFSLALGERAEQLTLLLDVPRAPEHAEPWDRMVEAAAACAERTGGRVVDDAGRPLTAPAAAEVGRQLATRYRTLQEAGLDAGSPAALRVFN